KITNDAFSILENRGFIVSLSNIALDESYFSQLPTNFQFRPRVSLISSLNFAGLNSLHNNPIGKSSNNAWGNAVTVFKTDTDTPFYFNFHQAKMGRDDFGQTNLGHTMILGKSGTGKTVLSSFLLNQSMQYRLNKSFPKNSSNRKMTAIFLDKDYGAEIHIRALGGQYNRLKNGLATGFNPFMLENSPTNIEFLNQFVSILATSDGSKLSTADKEQINFAVKAVMSLSKDYRVYGI